MIDAGWLYGHVRDSVSGSQRLRYARAEVCRCGAPVLCGLSGAVCAFWATMDPFPLSPTGEAYAALSGRFTAVLRHVGGRWVFVVRDPWHVRDPFSARYGDILAEHRCGDAPPEHVIIVSRHYQDHQSLPDDNDVPPF